MRRTALILFPSAVLAALAGCADDQSPTGVPDNFAARPRTALIGAPTAPSGAANGKIAFTSYRDGTGQIYVMNADGSEQTNVTNSPGPNFEPAWSPDGAKIVFISQRGREGSKVYVMNADGSGQTKLTNSPGGHGRPTWSPDGTRIAFVSNRDGGADEIYLMNADGTAPTRLTNNAFSDAEPTWSPDGQKIAFRSCRNANCDIYVMNADGSAQTRLSDNPAADEDPAWSPDGSKIVFLSNRDGNNEIYVMNADGSGQRNLTNSPTTSDRDPAWSPDGTKVLFTTSPGGDPEIHVMNPDGSGQTNVSNHVYTGTDEEPAWQPLPRPQAITFTSTPPAPALLGATYALGATGGASGNPVTFASLTPAVCTVAGNVVRFVDVGACTVAADQAGGAGYLAAPRVTQAVAVRYAFAGFLRGNPPAVNVVQAGRAVLLGFRLGGYHGLDVLATGSPTSRPVVCTVTAGLGGGSPLGPPVASALRYDAAAQAYAYTWQTERAWARTCREFVLTLKDGTSYTLRYQFL